MADVSSDGIDVTLGRLEDELLQVRSAREQVDDVVSASLELMAHVRQSTTQLKQCSDALATEASRLERSSESFTRISSETIEAVKGQAASAQATIEASAGEQLERASSELSGLTEQAIADLNATLGSAKTEVGTSVESLGAAVTSVKETANDLRACGAEVVEAIRKQDSDSQAALQQAASTIVENVSSDIATLAKKAVEDIDAILDTTKAETDTATETLKEATSAAISRYDALLDAQEHATFELEKQSLETRKLLESARQLVSEVDGKIATLQSIDVEGLKDEVKSLKDIEADNMATLKKGLTGVYVMVGICIIVCAAILVRMFMA